MRVVVDIDSCEGHGQCVEVAPEVFRLNGFVVEVIEASPGEDLRQKVDEAVRLCPTSALYIEN